MKIKIISNIVIVFAILISSQSCKKEEDTTPEVAVKIGATAPDFSVPDINGDLYKLSDFRGNYVVVDFWAAWCGICRTENPKMQNLYNEYKDKGVEFMGVCIDENRENWKQAVIDDGLSYLQLIDESAFESQVAQTYGITSVPFMMLIDSDGIILTFTSRVSDIEAKLQQVSP